MAKPGKVRIITGQWRGRKLDVVDLPGLRPTPDRVRETLFNWLQMEIPAAICLDLFAGTGALGFEALSRDAAEVVLVESNRTLYEQLQSQALLLGSNRHVIQHTDALRWLQQTTKQFDIIFLDPPFKQGFIENCCQHILERNLLKSNGKIYIEAEKGLELPTAWRVIQHKQAGQVQSALLAK